jgi:membrane-associated protease RseP (regulator of RpoE activity)
MKPVFRLADAIVLLLLLMLPAMLLLGAAEGRAGAPTVLFWLLLLLPLLLLSWLFTCRAPEEAANGARAAALQVPRDSGLAVQFQSLVAPIVVPRRAYVEQGVPVVEGEPQVERSQLFRVLDRVLGASQLMPLVEELDGRSVRVIGLPRAVEARIRTRSSIWVNVFLFIATLMTTVYAGARQQGINLLESPAEFAVGLPYALALLGILGVHEMGHYLMARRHGVAVTLPYFIPVPMGLGTFGAFIQMKSLIKSRRAVFDIGIAGPLAGLVVAVPVFYFGLQRADVAATSDLGVATGSSLFLALMYQLAHGGDLGAAAVNLSPAAFAGWIGIFVTGLNLLPVGQLDGGHIAYALFGRRRATMISVGTVLLMVALGLLVWPGLLMWALLITLIAGFGHMPALDDVTPPDLKRFALGVLTLVLPLLIVLPLPDAVPGTRLDSPYQQ